MDSGDTANDTVNDTANDAALLTAWGVPPRARAGLMPACVPLDDAGAVCDVGAVDEHGLLTLSTLLDALEAAVRYATPALWFGGLPSLVEHVEGVVWQGRQRLTLADAACVPRLARLLQRQPWLAKDDATYDTVVCLLSRASWASWPTPTARQLPQLMTLIARERGCAWSAVLEQLGYEAVLACAARHWPADLPALYPLLDLGALTRATNALRQHQGDADFAPVGVALAAPLLTHLDVADRAELWQHHLAPLFSQLGWAHAIPRAYLTVDTLRAALAANPQLTGVEAWASLVRAVRDAAAAAGTDGGKAALPAPTQQARAAWVRAAREALVKGDGGACGVVRDLLDAAPELFDAPACAHLLRAALDGGAPGSIVALLIARHPETLTPPVAWAVAEHAARDRNWPLLHRATRLCRRPRPPAAGAGAGAGSVRFANASPVSRPAAGPPAC